MKRLLKIFLLTFILFTVSLWIYASSLTPSNDRDWTPTQKTLATAEIFDTYVVIKNVRNYRHLSRTEYTADYYDTSFVLADLVSTDYIVVPFSGTKGFAHTFITFGFKGGRYLAVSVEVRKKRGQKFSVLKGMVNQFEIMYVLADEMDAIDLRVNVHDDKVYLYPMKGDHKIRKDVFLDICKRMNTLTENPEFYNTVTNNCAISIVRHLNRFLEKPIGYSYKLFFPAFSDRLAYQLSMIDTELQFDEARKRFLINERAKKYRNHKDYSKKIREE